MARLSDPKKLALWRGRFRCFLDSGLSVARFCAVEQVSESSFYYWQKKLGPQALRRLARAKDRGICAKDCYSGMGVVDRNARVKDRNARVNDRDAVAENHDSGAEDGAIGAEYRGVFQPVTVVPATRGVVVRLPGGARIEVDADQLEAIRAVVAETVRVDRGWAVERSASPDNRNASSDNQVIRKRGGAVSC